jgi:hypothetical protein
MKFVNDNLSSILVENNKDNEIQYANNNNEDSNNSGTLSENTNDTS